MKNKNNFFKIVTIILILLLSYFIFNTFTLEKIRELIQGNPYSAIIYILLFSILPIFFFPVPILAFAAGVSFGLWEGVLYTLIGAIINSSIMFLMAKNLAKDKVNEFFRKKISKKWYDKIMNMEREKSFIILFIMRLLPIAPYNVINYVAGLTEMTFSRYTIATFFGIIPGTFVFLNVGDKAINIYSYEFLVSIIAFILLMVFSIILLKKFDRN